jgi:hypothetical protein
VTDTPATSRTRRPIALLVILLPMICICGASGSVTAIGDQGERHATHQAGVPLHQEPRGTHDFQRIPDGTRAHVQICDTPLSPASPEVGVICSDVTPFCAGPLEPHVERRNDSA